jgi:hypothetical protein
METGAEFEDPRLAALGEAMSRAEVDRLLAIRKAEAEKRRKAAKQFERAFRLPRAIGVPEGKPILPPR